MGYYISMVCSEFDMPAENKALALKALQGMWAPHNASKMGGSFGGQVEVRFYSWMNNSSLADGTCSSFEQAMSDWRYPVETDDDGNVISIAFDGEKIGDEAQMFSVVAPFVTSGSYIEMQGEDRLRWRWVFNLGRFAEIYPTVTWPDPD